MNEKKFEGIINDEEKVKREGAEEILEHGNEETKRYQGIINEKDYQSVLDRAKDTTTLDKTLISQAEGIAKRAGIDLHNSEDALDPRTILYGILRSDIKPEGVKYHHSQMSDQRLFAEALRMSGDADSLKKLIETYPNISF